MATTRYYGAVGYGESAVTESGVWEDHIVEYNYYGNVVRNTRTLIEGDKVNNDLSVGNSISVLADPYANEHFHAIRYIWWAGTRWIVSNVDVEGPRLILRLGGVYNGPGPEAAATPGSP